MSILVDFYLSVSIIDFVGSFWSTLLKADGADLSVMVVEGGKAVLLRWKLRTWLERGYLFMDLRGGLRNSYIINNIIYVPDNSIAYYLFI